MESYADSNQIKEGSTEEQVTSNDKFATTPKQDRSVTQHRY